MIWRDLVEVPWIVFVVYWLVSALHTRRAVKQESRGSRSAIGLMVFVGFFLLFSRRNDLNVGFLGEPILPRTYAFSVAAVAFTWIGIALAIWARWHLGEYWSGRVTLKEDHKLIRTGPYAYFRHPIYSGIGLAAIGGVLAIDRWRSVLGALFIIAAHWIKARKEEALLAQQFGPAFDEHRRHTGFLLPKF